MTAKLVRSYEHENALVAGSQGNVQTLANGDWIVGWGQAGYLSEVTPTGQVLFNAHLPPEWESYRTFAQPWSGQPAEPPALAVCEHADGQPSSTRAGTVRPKSPPGGCSPVPRRARWRRSRTPPKAGFETAIATPASVTGGYVAVQALNGAGAVIGTSRTIKG